MIYRGKYLESRSTAAEKADKEQNTDLRDSSIEEGNKHTREKPGPP